MNDSPAYMKWFYRMLLLSVFIIMSYVVTRSGYNFAHWVPHRFLREMGLSYNALLWGERNADVALHFLGAAILVWLVYLAALPVFSLTPKRAFVTVVILCLGAELFQLWIGRGFQTSDLLLGIVGGFMAYLMIDKYKTSSS